MKLLLSLLSLSFALNASPITQVALIDAGNPALSNRGNAVGPYHLRVDGKVIPVLCIDFNDSSKIGTHWSAATSKLNGDLTATYHPDERSAYAAEAYLYTLILKPGADRMDLQQAAWAITDSSYHANAAAEKLVRLAEEKASSINPAYFEVISEAPGLNARRQQELLTAETPEPGLTHLIAGLLAVGLVLLARKRN